MILIGKNNKEMNKEMKNIEDINRNKKKMVRILDCSM